MKIELRADNSIVIEGYVNVTGRESRPIPGTGGAYVEIVHPGAFADAIERNPEIPIKLDHQKVIGDTDHNLVLQEDNIGLYARAIITDQEVIDLAKANELRGWSFAFVDPKEKWEVRADNLRQRTLLGFMLTDVSVVDQKAIPIYPATSIETRAQGERLIEYRATFADEKIELINNLPKDPPEKHPAAVPDYSNLKRKIEILKLKG